MCVAQQCTRIKSPTEVSPKPMLVGGGYDNTAALPIATGMEVPYGINQVIAILNQYKDPESLQQASRIPAVKPAGGEVYVFWDGNDPLKQNDWKCDQYRWINGGNHKLPRKEPVVRKIYSRINVHDDSKNGSDEFVRHAYCLIDNPGVWIIHYIGNENVYVPSQHGNRTHGKQECRRTCPSIMKAMKEAVENEKPGHVYKKMVTPNVSVAQQGILNPRNRRQLTNMRQRVQENKRLSKYDVYNLLQLAYHLPETVWKIDLYPDLVSVVGVKEVMDELNQLLDTKAGTLLGYDTTFKLGDFYVSALVFRHTVFNEEPVIPAAFLIHDRKYQKVHQQFFDLLKEKVPNLGKKDFKIVTDRESGITTALENVFPQAHVLHCWNHVTRDLKFWLKKHGATQDDISVYKQDVLTVMRADSEKELLAKVDDLSEKWSQPMVEYFNSELKSDIMKHSAKFVLAPLGLYDPFSGITNNISESMNCVMKDLLDWKEVPVDVIVLCFQMLQNYYLAEVRRGFGGIGTYTLTPRYSSSACDPEDIVLPSGICDPQDIVSRIKKYS